MDDAWQNILQDLRIVLPIIDGLEEKDDGSFFFLTSTLFSLWLIPGIIIGLMASKFSAGLFIALIVSFNIISVLVMRRKEKLFEKEYAAKTSELGISDDRASELLEFWKNTNMKRRKRMRRALEGQLNA